MMNNRNQSKRAGRRFYASPLLVAGAIAATLIPELREAWAFTAGESTNWFTGLTSHAVHWSTEHLIWSGGAFLLLGLVCEKLSQTRFWSTLLLSGIAIPVGLFALDANFLAERKVGCQLLGALGEIRTGLRTVDSIESDSSLLAPVVDRDRVAIVNTNDLRGKRLGQKESRRVGR